MALIKLLQNNETDNTETSSSAKSFLSNTIRSILFSSGSGKESEIDKRLKKISLKEVSDHDCSNDCWITIYDRVYDVTEFLNHHPGGDSVLLEYAGRDCTEAFRGHSNDAVLSLKQYEIGVLPAHERIYRFPGMIRISESKPE